MNRIIFRKIFFFSVLFASLTSCEETTQSYYDEQAPGKVVIRGYSLTDSLQIASNSKLLKINEKNTFKGEIAKDYEFVYYNHESKNLKIIDKQTQTELHSYTFTTSRPVDSLSFFYKPGIWIDNVLSFSPGVLSQPGYTGYRFIFPNINRYSGSSYEGAIDGILRKLNGEVLGIVENINKEDFSTFVEFPFGSPPIIKMELVKHGTTESYITGQQVFVTMVMQNNKSRLVVLEEKQENGAFSGVDGITDLVDYFDF